MSWAWVALAAFGALPMARADSPPADDPARWKGVDETVVGRFAEEGGRPPREPFINTDQGDLLLFVFLLAGAAGGFMAGYCFRALFPPKNAPSTAEKPGE